MERKWLKTIRKYREKFSLTVWEQEARGSSPRTPTTFGRKTAVFGGFSAFFILFLWFGRLLFCGGSRDRKVAGA